MKSERMTFILPPASSAVFTAVAEDYLDGDLKTTNLVNKMYAPDDELKIFFLPVGQCVRSLFWWGLRLQRRKKFTTEVTEITERRRKERLVSKNYGTTIPAAAGRSTFLCGLCALCGEAFLRGGVEFRTE